MSPRNFLLPIVAVVGFAAPAWADPDGDAQHAEVTRQLNEARKRVRQLEQKLSTLEKRSARAGSSSLAGSMDRCATPFRIDRDGVKHVRAECAAAEEQASCETTPFDIGLDGIKRLRPTCNF
jgi:hypothetical protein